ncbi:MAG TPA: signal peptidase II [Candidatus Limnocylindrales bacterium]|nr:signal peptidase II [Candidatus Limnocylindrales bacterium]
MSGRPIWPLFLGLAAVVAVLDQLTKAWLTSILDPGESVQVIGDYVRLVHGQNNGALFGLFRESALLFGIVSVGVIGLIVVYHARSGRSVYLSVTLGLLLGGAIGNLIDRFRLGYVVDFVDIGVGSLRFYTFNVADMAISLSLILLVLLAIRPSLAGTAPPVAGEPATSPPTAPNAHPQDGDA